MLVASAARWFQALQRGNHFSRPTSFADPASAMKLTVTGEPHGDDARQNTEDQFSTVATAK